MRLKNVSPETAGNPNPRTNEAEKRLEINGRDENPGTNQTITNEKGEKQK